jgi:hypothetical protein
VKVADVCTVGVGLNYSGTDICICRYNLSVSDGEHGIGFESFWNNILGRWSEEESTQPEGWKLI